MARKTNYHNTAYIEGNVVRRQQTAPQGVPEVPQRQPVSPPKSREEIIRERERRLHAKRNLARAAAFDRGYLIYLTAVTAVCGLLCFVFLYLQSNITTHMAAITELETTVGDLQSDNDAEESRLETSMTISEIRERAEELGLVYPSSDQIQYYSVENNDYMNQY
ncbi:MAG: hypothetical protein LUC83_11210 [Clostridiales bacterium]|nr:hypothetical protein [Clostridiales bacterium]